jgi:AraC-like DNA-binding protein
MPVSSHLEKPTQPLFALPGFQCVVSLFDCLPPEVIFYAKDRHSRFIAANSAMLAAKSLTAPEQLLGRSDHDFHPSAMADAFVAEDRAVIESGQSELRKLWFVIDLSGRPGWFISSKVPLISPEGQVVGLAGLRYPIETPHERTRQFKRLAPVVRHLEKHYTQTVSMTAMADLCGLSSTHFNRAFRSLFGMNPTRFLHCLRTEKARQLLAKTDRTLGAIAHAIGYHDQSHFTKHFRQITGLTPKHFRSQKAPR